MKKDQETWVVASHNKGKLVEIAALLAPLGLKAISAAELNLAEPEETEDSFIGNALLKARAAAKSSGLVALSDDSGLEVFGLGPKERPYPGIYSARWAGPEKNFGLAMDKVLAQLAQRDDRSARFVCALALVWPDGKEIVFEGQVLGTIAPEKRGNKGFGYDPIFIEHRDDITYGETEPAVKHAKSHRAHAFAQMVAYLSI